MATIKQLPWISAITFVTLAEKRGSILLSNCL